MNQSLTLAFLIAAGIGLVVQNTLMVRITQTSSTILIAMLLNSLVGIVLFVSILWFKQGMAGFGELVSSVRWWTLIPGLLGSFFVFASISGYQNVGAATTIAVLVASQLIGGLMLDIFRSHGVIKRWRKVYAWQDVCNLLDDAAPLKLQTPPWLSCPFIMQNR